MPNLMMEEIFLVCPKKYLPGYVREEDRQYFSKPVRVEIVSKGDGKIYTVTDPIRGHTYPADKANLVRGWRLTNKQMAAAKAAVEAAEQANQPEGAK